MVRVRVVTAITGANSAPMATLRDGRAITTPVAVCGIAAATIRTSTDNLIWQ